MKSEIMLLEKHRRISSQSWVRQTWNKRKKHKHKTKDKNCTSLKLRTSFGEETPLRVKCKVELEDICNTYVNKVLVSRICKEPLQLKNKNQTIQL